MAKEKRSEIIAEDLGDDALEALHQGRHWEYRPKTIEGADQWVRKSDVEHRWITWWYVSGWEVRSPDSQPEGPREWSPHREPGTLWHLIWQVDEVDWQVIDEMNVDEPGYMKWAKRFSYETSQKGWCSYYKYVMRWGRDPLGIFHSSSPRRVEKLWEFVIEDPGMIFVHARPVGSPDWIPPDRLPEWVLEFFFLERKGEAWNVQLDYKDIAELVKKTPSYVKWEKVSPGRAQGVAPIIEIVPPDPKEVRAAAKEAVSECP